MPGLLRAWRPVAREPALRVPAWPVRRVSQVQRAQPEQPEQQAPHAPALRVRQGLPVWQGLLQLAAVIGVILCALLGLFSQDRTAMWLWLAAAAACLILRLTLALIRRRAMRDDAPPQT